MKRKVSIFEHATAKLSEGALAGFDAAYFDALNSYIDRNYPQKPLSVERSVVRAGSLVGTVFFRGLQFEILPKLLGKSDGTDHSSLYKNFLAILAITKNVEVSLTELQKLGAAADSLLEVYIELFATLLERELTLRPNRSYVQVAENLGCLRGRINFSTDLRLNILHRERVFCEFDEFSEDNDLNKLFKFVAKKLTNVTRAESSFTRLRAIVSALSEVGDKQFGPTTANKIELTRLNAGYAIPLRLAKLFVAGFSPEPRSGKEENLGIVFDMNKVFEEFIFEVLKRNKDELGIEVASQKKSALSMAYQNLGDPEFKNLRAFGTRSDIVVELGGGARAVIDTKYKILNPDNQRTFDISNSDVYQVLAYASILEERGERVLPVLVYPQPFNGTKGIIRRIFHTAEANSRAFLVLTVPMFENLADAEVRYAIGRQIIELCNLTIRNTGPRT